MDKNNLLKTLSILVGFLFVFSILTVESHAAEKGNLAGKLPTIIDGTIEYAVAVADGVDLNPSRRNEFLTSSLDECFINKDSNRPQMYRGPPLVSL